ncbi:hypothetical protein MLD38_034494 [Melastoma candidum]|uniref:Uncharacterized protein n=1 Tax=Melastoma candidum TaxID=119954 RepID=A0ACB9M9W3_9MYRT|nr:hypothetical protein MLD38_034494 [Melastoma candidum]
MLVKYREEMTRLLQEAMEFMRRIEAQLNSMSSDSNLLLLLLRLLRLVHLTRGIRNIWLLDVHNDKCEGFGSLEELLQENSGGETDQLLEIDPRAGDGKLKNHLRRKYAGN